MYRPLILQKMFLDPLQALVSAELRINQQRLGESYSSAKSDEQNLAGMRKTFAELEALNQLQSFINRLTVELESNQHEGTTNGY